MSNVFSCSLIIFNSFSLHLHLNSLSKFFQIGTFCFAKTIIRFQKLFSNDVTHLKFLNLSFEASILNIHHWAGKKVESNLIQGCHYSWFSLLTDMAEKHRSQYFFEKEIILILYSNISWATYILAAFILLLIHSYMFFLFHLL